jgi:hypothetical protein
MHCNIYLKLRLLGRGAQSRRVFSSNTVENNPPKDMLGIVFFSAVCLATGSLGVWQVQRLVGSVDLVRTQSYYLDFVFIFTKGTIGKLL